MTDATTTDDGIDNRADERADSDLPTTKYEAACRLTDLESEGVTVVWDCGECGGPVETTVLPEEREKPNHRKVTICRACILVGLCEEDTFGLPERAQ